MGFNGDIIDSVKEYCEYEIQTCKKYNSNPHLALTRSYGAMMFVLTIASDEKKSNDLGRWWDNEMHPRFNELLTKAN